MENICRICRKEDQNLISMFSSSKNNKNTSALEEAYEVTTGLPISIQDNLPHGVCKRCKQRLTDAYTLYKEAIKSYYFFLENKYNENTNEKAYEEEYYENDGQDDQSEVSVNIIINNKNDETENEDENEINQEYEVIFEKTNDEDVDPLAEESEIDTETNAVDFLTSKDLTKFIKNQGNNSSQIRKQRKTYSVDEKKYQCQVCQKRFLRRSNLVDHLRLHAKIKPFQCEYCDKAFVQVGNYKSHLRIHTKERPYVCDICKKSYNQSSALKVHIRSHTNERNYCCETCGKAFTNSSDLGKHKRLHNPDQQFKCPHCDKLFAQKCNLRSHVKKKHDENST